MILETKKKTTDSENSENQKQNKKQKQKNKNLSDGWAPLRDAGDAFGGSLILPKGAKTYPTRLTDVRMSQCGDLFLIAIDKNYPLGGLCL